MVISGLEKKEIRIRGIRCAKLRCDIFWQDVKESFREKITFEQRPERDEGVSTVNSEEKELQATGRAHGMTLG